MIQKKSLKDAIQNSEIISVVGGLLNIGSALLYKGVINNSDFNSLTTTGYYFIQSNVSNGPNTYWGYLYVFYFSEQIVQIFIPNINTTAISIRRAVKSLLNIPWYQWKVEAV